MPTRAEIEKDVIVGNRLAAAMARAGLSVETDGFNSDLDTVLRDALVSEGIFPVDPLVVADIDLVNLSGPSLMRFRVVAHLRVVEMIIDAWDLGMTPSQPTDSDKAFIVAMQRRRTLLLEEVRRPIRPADAPAVGQYTGHRIGAVVPCYPDLWL
jgi:hypothetical protein